MHRNSFVCFYARTICPTLTIFNKKHSIVNLNNTILFQYIPGILTRIRTSKDRQTKRMHKHFSTLLESICLCVNPHIENLKKKHAVNYNNAF